MAPKTFLFGRGNSNQVIMMAKRKAAKVAKEKAVKVAKLKPVKVAKVKAVKGKAVKAVKAPKEGLSEFKLALVVLIFGAATAFSSVYKLGNITILFGLVAAAAALAMTVKKK